MNFNNKFKLGNKVSVSRYDIKDGTIVGIEPHFKEGTDEVQIWDYDVLYINENGDYESDHYSEHWIELI